MALRAALCFLAVAASEAARTRHRRKQTSESTFSGAPPLAAGEKGRISALYTFGSPASASPPLRNPARPDGCWPGLRVVTAKEEGWLLPQFTDPAPLVTEPFGFEQVPIEAAKIFLDSDDKKIKWASCGETWENTPTEIVDPFLHSMGRVYIPETIKFALGEKVHEIINVGLNVSAKRLSQQAEIQASVQSFGWNLIGTAEIEGIDWVSDSVSHLIQEPRSKSCMLTFRGSRSLGDWVNNVQIVKGHFCGLVQEDEECGSLGNCETRDPQGSFIHKGFGKHFLKLLSLEDWKKNIKPHLSGCSEVMALGHSLGGVSAAYFGRCAAQGLRPGDYGFEDFDLVTWTASEPRVLPPWGQ